MINGSICPFCKSENNCMAHSNALCWCNDVKVPQDLSDLVPKDLKKKTCICLNCIKAYVNDPETFRLEHP